MIQIDRGLLISLVFLTSLGFNFGYLKWAQKYSVLDIPNERSSHNIPVPRGGGIVFVTIFYLTITLLYLFGQIERTLFLSLLPGIILAVVGLIDDIKSLGPLFRLCVQVICAGVSLFLLGGFQVSFLSSFTFLWSLTALVGIIWFANLFNFLDGSDGYASTEAILLLLGMYLITDSISLLILASAVAGFLFWNWPKAKMFMGDSGSVALGFILAVYGIYMHNTCSMDISVWLIMTILFWFDATITLIRRLINGEKFSQAHKKHIYQRAIQGGISHLRLLITATVLNVVLLILAYLIYRKSIEFFPGFIFAIVILSFLMRYVDKRIPFTSMN